MVTKDVNISETVYPIYLKIIVRRVASGNSLHIEFQVKRMNRYRDIVVGSLPKKCDIIFGVPFWGRRLLSREARVSRRQAELPGARSAPDEARLL